MKTSALLLSLLLLGILPTWGESDWKKEEKVYKEVARIAKRYPTKKFHQAVRNGDLKAVRRLLDSGVPVSLSIPVEDHNGIPPWFQAIHEAGDNPALMRLLLARGADPNARDSNRSTPLHHANEPEVVKLLLDRGADISARNSDGEQPIHFAARGSESAVSFCRLLIKHGADPKSRDENGIQPIHLAARGNSVKLVEFFLNQGASPSAVAHAKEEHSHDGWQPLHFVGVSATFEAGPQDAEIVRLLIRRGADVNATTSDGKTPLHLLESPAVTRQLLGHGATVNVRDKAPGQETPLHHLARAGDLESVRLLLDHGAQLEAQDEFGGTPLDQAAFWGRKDVVAYLLSKGAKPTRHTLAQAERSKETAEIAGMIRTRLSPNFMRPAHRR